jgi:hypothetical protein
MHGDEGREAMAAGWAVVTAALGPKKSLMLVCPEASGGLNFALDFLDFLAKKLLIEV